VAGGRPMDALRLAYLEVMLARAAWRAAKDVEAQVAHWVVEGVAEHRELVEARRRSRALQAVMRRADRVYMALSAAGKAAVRGA
jgi:hypothetical protein